MQFFEGQLYHIYNRGNYKQKIFFKPDHYRYFISKMRKHLFNIADFLAWSLMPNHFHILLQANETSVQLCKNRILPIQQLSEGIRMTLSGYTKGINNNYGKTGNLFQQKTKCKCVEDIYFPQEIMKITRSSYATEVFHYIHQNPVVARLTTKMEDWEYSSFREYAGLAETNFCNKKLTEQLIGINKETFYSDSYMLLNAKLFEKHIFENSFTNFMPPQSITSKFE